MAVKRKTSKLVSLENVNNNVTHTNNSKFKRRPTCSYMRGTVTGGKQNTQNMFTRLWNSTQHTPHCKRKITFSLL